MAKQWEYLQELQMLEVQLKDLREARESTETGTLRKLWEEVRETSSEVRTAADRQAALHKQSRSLEMDLAAADEQRKTLERRLYGAGCSSSREMEQVKAKAEAATMDYQRMENKLLELMEQQEDNDMSLAQKSHALDAAREQHRRLQAEIAKKLERLDGEINAKEQQRCELLKVIDVPLLREFNGLRAKKAQPMIRVENGACGFCKMTAVGPMIGQTGIFRCEHCGRLMIPEEK